MEIHKLKAVIGTMLSQPVLLIIFIPGRLIPEPANPGRSEQHPCWSAGPVPAK